MIQEKSGFWDSIDPTPGNSGDERTYNAGEVTIPFEYLVTNGVQIGGAFLQVTPGSYDYSSQIAPGFAWINGRWYLLKDDGTGGATKRILLHDAPIQYNRIDRVVLRYDANYTLSGRKIVAAVLKGVEAASPVAPALTRNDEIYELSLARVLIKPGQPIILTGDITDERFESALCGIAEFAPQPDLQPYIEQFQQQLNAMFGDLEALDAAAITSGVLNAARLPDASTSAAGKVKLSSALDSTSEVLASTPKALKAVNDKAVDLERSRTYIVATNAGGNNFTAADTSVTAYSNGLRRTVFFTTASDAPQLNINGMGYRPVLQASGVSLKVKAYQMVDIIAENVSFFAVRSGGGVELPSTVAAGETLLMSAVGIVGSSAEYTWQTVWVSGWIFHAAKTGTYRIRFFCAGDNGNNATRLNVDGTTAVANSEITAGLKVIDVSLAAGQKLYLQVRGYTMSSSGEGRYARVHNFNVSILAADMQTELSKAGYAYTF